jgi:sulfate permease, SulP family
MRFSPSTSSPWGRAREMLGALDEVHVASLLLGGGALLVVLVLRWKTPSVPGALLAVVGGAVAAASPVFSGQGIAVIGAIPSGVPPLGWPKVSMSDFEQMIGAALAIALVAGADTIATARAFAARGHYDVDTNLELAGLGAANVLSGVSGGVAASASAARTAVAESVGAHTPMASVVAAGTLVVVLTTLTAPLERVPLAALAAVVIAAVARLIDIGELRSLWHTLRSEAAIAVVTAMAVVALGALQAILIALALSAAQWAVIEHRKAQRAARQADR